MKPGYFVGAAAAALITSASLALAAEPSGAALAGSCYTCHGASGASTGEIPPLAGIDAGAMAGKLEAFRSDSTPSTIMNRIAKGYTSDEIAAIVAYLASAN